MNQLEKEINIADKSNMAKRYEMYGTSLTKLMEKAAKEAKKEENGSHGV